MTTPTRPHYTTTSATVPEAVQFLLDGKGGRCGCTGQCERHHAGGRCDANELACLTVASADLTIPLEQAAILPADQLVVWCHRCRDLAQAAANRRRREQVDAQIEETQLGLWGAA